MNEESTIKANTGFYFKVSKSVDGGLNEVGGGGGNDVLSLKEGDVVVLISSNPDGCSEQGWWYGEKIGDSSQKGKFPAMNVMQIVSSNPDVSAFEVPFEELYFDRANDFLGNGGFGQVYRGVLRSEDVAVKIPNNRFTNSTDEPTIIKKLKKEAYIQYNLNHDNIVKLLHISLDNPVDKCLILEYCAGGPLNTVVYNCNVPFEVLIDWACQIADGMHYLHHCAQVPIVHKDLKSGNILICQPVELNNGDTFYGKTLKITDFGLAKPIEENHFYSTQGGGGGTVEWMSPEVIKKSQYSFASDSWSYGVVLWELLIGQSPFKGVPFYVVLYNVGQKNLKLPIPDEMLQSIKDLLMGCWDDLYRRITFRDIVKKLENLREEISSMPNLTPEEFDMYRKNSWLPCINYDYVTTEPPADQTYQILVEEFVKVHREKRECEMILAEKTLKEELDKLQTFQRGNERSTKGKKHRKKPKNLNPANISFPQEVKHVIGLVDDNKSPFGNSLDMLDRQSFASSHHSVSYSHKLPQLEMYNTWSGHRKGRRILPANQIGFQNGGAEPEGDSRGYNCIGAWQGELARSNSCKDKVSRSEGNIIGALSNGEEDEDSIIVPNEQFISSEPNCQKTSFPHKIIKGLKKFSLSGRRSSDKDRKLKATVGTPIKPSTATYVKCDYPQSPRGPDFTNELSKPEVLVKISSHERPTHLDLTARTHRSSQGSSIQQGLSTYSDEFLGESSWSQQHAYSHHNSILSPHLVHTPNNNSVSVFSPSSGPPLPPPPASMGNLNPNPDYRSTNGHQYQPFSPTHTPAKFRTSTSNPQNLSSMVAPGQGPGHNPGPNSLPAHAKSPPPIPPRSPCTKVRTNPNPTSLSNGSYITEDITL